MEHDFSGRSNGKISGNNGTSEKVVLGRFPFNQNFRKFGNSGKWYRNFLEKFPEILETVEFPKCEPFNRKF